MKWRLRRAIDNSALFLVSIKPVRWFFDQILRFGKWAGKNSILLKIWKWCRKLVKPAWIAYLLYALTIDAWSHNIFNVSIDVICLLVWLILPDREDPSDEDDEEPDEPDPTPDGDAVDMWLREQQRISI